MMVDDPIEDNVEERERLLNYLDKVVDRDGDRMRVGITGAFEVAGEYDKEGDSFLY